MLLYRKTFLPPLRVRFLGWRRSYPLEASDAVVDVVGVVVVAAAAAAAAAAVVVAFLPVAAGALLPLALRSSLAAIGSAAVVTTRALTMVVTTSVFAIMIHPSPFDRATSSRCLTAPGRTLELL